MCALAAGALSGPAALFCCRAGLLLLRYCCCNQPCRSSEPTFQHCPRSSTCPPAALCTLRRAAQMEFGGFVVSDCGAIDSILQHHEYAGTPAEAAAVALWAGTDVACTDFSALWAAAMQGLVPEERIGDSVRRVLVAR